MKLQEVAKRLGVSEKSARRYVKSGEIPSVFVGNAYRISEQDLVEYLARARVRAGESGQKAKSPIAAEMEATLLAIRENVEVLERYFDNPPDEAAADKAIDRFYDLMPKPLEHLSLMHPDEMRQYIGEVREVFEAQAKINRQLEAWNVAQYSHLHKQHA